MKKFNSSQNGFTPTLTFKQSIVRVLKYCNSISVFFINEIVHRREPGSQLKNKCQGFSLVETFVAITILLIIIVGPMTISSTVAKSTSFSSEQVIAFLLAQEGAEIALKARDDMQIEFFDNDTLTPWTDFSSSPGSLYDACFLSTGCGLELATDDVGSVAIVNCSSADCRLRYNGDEDERAQYTHELLDSTPAANELSPYTRVVTFELINVDEIKVTSRVTWRTGSLRKSQEVIVETYLLNVYGN